MREVDIEKLINELDMNTMTTLKDYLAHDKSNNDRKFEHVGEALSMTQKLSRAQYKIDCARQLLKKMIEDSILEKCGSGKKGIESMIHLLNLGIEKKKAKEEARQEARAEAEAALAARNLLQRIVG